MIYGRRRSFTRDWNASRMAYSTEPKSYQGRKE